MKYSWTSLFKVVNVLLHSILNKNILKICIFGNLQSSKLCVMKVNYIVNIPSSI